MMGKVRQLFVLGAFKFLSRKIWGKIMTQKETDWWLLQNSKNLPIEQIANLTEFDG